MLKILIAEDERWARENLCELVKKSGGEYELVESAADGEDAIEKIKHFLPDILITDINMPFVNGVQLTEEISRSYPKMVVIVVSGYSDFEYVRKTMLSGAVDYLLKPVSQEDLNSVLQKAEKKLSSRKNELITESTLFDRKMSLLLDASENDDEEIKPDTSFIMDYELRHSGFTLVLFKLHGYIKFSKIYEIKSIISRVIDDKDSIVFHNVFSSTEYICVTQCNQDLLAQKCHTIMDEIHHNSGFYCTSLMSRYSYSFGEFKKLYSELKNYFYGREYGAKNIFMDCRAEVEPNQNGKGDLPDEQDFKKQMEYAVKTNNRALFLETLSNFQSAEKSKGKGSTYFQVRRNFELVYEVMRSSKDFSQRKGLFELESLWEEVFRNVEYLKIEENQKLLVHICDDFFGSEDLLKQSVSVQKIIPKIKDYIQANYADDISLSSLAQLFAIDAPYLSRSFKDAVGENLMAYIAQIRIQKAKELMANKSLGIIDIANMVGYDDYAYFNRVFKKISGESPRQYRKEM